MKRLATLLYLGGFLALLPACQRDSGLVPATTNPDPVINAPYFKQENTSFRAAQVDCLIDRWRNQTTKDTITLGVINDQTTYQHFFCGSTTTLPAIDFSTYTLLIGFASKAAATGVSNITGIEQNLVLTPTGQYDYQVTVTGKTKGAGEWFGFCGLAAKISDPNRVRLTMAYKLN